MIVPNQDDKGKDGDFDDKNDKGDGDDDQAKKEKEERMKKDFPNIQEDKFDSDEDDDYKKNK